MEFSIIAQTLYCFVMKNPFSKKAYRTSERSNTYHLYSFVKTNAKKSVLNSTVTIVFAKNYLKHSKVNGICVKSTPVLAPLTSRFRSFDGLFFFIDRNGHASKIEEKCVPLDSQRNLGCMRVFPYMRMSHR